MTGTVRDMLAAATERLASAGVAAPRTDAEALLSYVVGTPRSRLHTLNVLSDDDATAFGRALARREAREPLQHITRRAAFRHLDLEVGSGVFVPRPETEVLTGAAVDELRRLVYAGEPAPRAVDLCAGSGAVALSMATEVSGCRVTAVELSAEAVGYAERNAATLAALCPGGAAFEMDVRCGDIVEAVDDLAGQVHVVTANPPYIPLGAFESVAVEARDFDPPLALWSGVDGLGMIRAVEEVAARLLVDGGLVLCEHADAQSQSAPAVFAATGSWAQVRDSRDLAGRPRFVSARRVPRGASRAGTMTG